MNEEASKEGLKPLYGEELLPVAFGRVTPEKLDGTAKEWGFGLGGKNVAEMLRKLADKIDAGDVAVQNLDTSRAASLEDFEYHTVSITYAERVRGV
jgi:hypothetical protein